VTYNYNSNGDDWTGTCSAGSSQSPIDIDGGDATETSGQSFTFNLSSVPSTAFMESWANQRYTATRTDGASFGTVTGYLPGSSSAVSFSCYRYEFHSPAEHEFDGDSFDLEMQIICYTSTSITTNNYAIYVNLYDKGDEDSFI
jgi:carbonic anhydrase